MFVNILFVVSLLLIYFWKDTKKPKDFPPGPTWMPIIGNLPILKYVKSFKFYHLFWSYLSSLYGPIVGLRFVNTKMVIVSGKEAIREFYGKEEFNGRPDGFFYRMRTGNKRLGIVFNDGEIWHEQRLFSVKTLRQLGMNKDSMATHIKEETEQMIEYFSMKAQTKEEISMHNAFDIPVLNVIWTYLNGERFDLQDERLHTLMESLHESFKVIDMTGGVLNLFPFIRHIFPEYSKFQPLIKVLQPLWEFIQTTINNTRESLDNSTESAGFIDSYLKEILNQKGNTNGFTDKQLASLCLDFFQAGSETTSNTLGFCMLYMIHHPKVLIKVKEEILNAVGRERMPTMNDRGKLKYCEAVLCEVQRIANVAPLGIVHRALETVKLGSYTIPKNTIALVLLHSLHMEKKYWIDPEVFRPERFIDANGNLIIHESFQPFGMGKRRCVGEGLAKQSLFMFFTSFVHSFDMIINGDPPILGADDGITLSAKPYKVQLQQRNI